MRPLKDDDLWKVYEGPRAVVRSCLWCDHVELVRKGLRGVGRGYGMREGNQARGRMVQHVKAEHPEEYRAALDAARARVPRRTCSCGAPLQGQLAGRCAECDR